MFITMDKRAVDALPTIKTVMTGNVVSFSVPDYLVHPLGVRLDGQSYCCYVAGDAAAFAADQAGKYAQLDALPPDADYAWLYIDEDAAPADFAAYCVCRHKLTAALVDGIRRMAAASPAAFPAAVTEKLAAYAATLNPFDYEYDLAKVYTKTLGA